MPDRITPSLSWHTALRLVQGLFLALLAVSAPAHLMPAQQGTLNVVGNAVFSVVALPVSALSQGDLDRDGRLSAAELHAGARLIREQLARRFRLFDGERVGRLDFLQLMAEADERLAPTDDAPDAPGAGARHFLVLMKTSFDAAPQSLRLETDLFGTESSARQLTLKATRGEDAEAAVLSPRRSTHQFFRSPAGVLADYGVVGVEHILLGADHLLFLLTILIGAAGWRYWLGVLTCFTLAHSVTLTLSLLGWVRAPVAVVEPLIAGSIVLMALLNLWQREPVAVQRMALVWGCGLLHGLGFASSIADMGLHGAHRLASVVGFNLGIELGQLVFLLVVWVSSRAWQSLPRAGLTGRWGDLPSAAHLSSWLASLLGSIWFFQRLGIWA